MQESTKEVKVYISDDGKEFLDPEQCRAYEKGVKALQSRLDNITLYRVAHGLDLSELRGFNSVLWVAVEGYPHQYLYDYLMTTLGSPVCLFYDRYESNWKEFLQKPEPRSVSELVRLVTLPQQGVGDNKADVSSVFLSPNAPITIEGMDTGFLSDPIRIHKKKWMPLSEIGAQNDH